MKYYYPQHTHGYARIQAEGKTSWGELHGGSEFDDFAARAFFSAVVPELQFDTSEPRVLVYGCGTGPDACYLAERGFSVKGIDLIPAAIEIAVQQAALRGLDIDYSVQDICDLSSDGEEYDMIVDSYCLQCIVFDNERQRIFSAVSSRLKPKGYYLVSTAVMDAEHRSMLQERETVTDNTSGTVFSRYGEDGMVLIETESGMVFIPFSDNDSITAGEEPAQYPDAKMINGQWYLPHRRWLLPGQLEEEVWNAGFRVIYRFPDYSGNLALMKR